MAMTGCDRTRASDALCQTNWSTQAAVNYLNGHMYSGRVHPLDTGAQGSTPTWNGAYAAKDRHVHPLDTGSGGMAHITHLDRIRELEGLLEAEKARSQGLQTRIDFLESERERKRQLEIQLSSHYNAPQ